MNDQEAKEIVRSAGVKLIETGLVAGTWGNLSVRLPENRMAITPSGRDYTKLTADDIVIVDIETGDYTGGKPSTEKILHMEIYRKRPEISAIVHTHSMSASTVAAARREVPPVLDDLAQIVGPSVRVAEYALPGSKKMSKNVLKALSGRMAALMANHGAIAVGRNMDEALLCCAILEKGCRAFIEAEFLGGAKSVHPVEAFLMHQVYLQKYSKQEPGDKK